MLAPRLTNLFASTCVCLLEKIKFCYLEVNLSFLGNYSLLKALIKDRCMTSSFSAGIEICSTLAMEIVLL